MEEQQQQDSPLPQPAPETSVDDDQEVKKCWICFSDSTEDTTETSPWRDPCPCALVAHEECLLDWIADMEAPKSTRRAGIAAPKIECPQCKAEIRLARPRDYLVDAVRAVERLGNRAVTPASVTTLFAVLYNSSMAAGQHFIYAVFGRDDGFRILQPIIRNAVRPPVESYMGSPHGASEMLLKVMIDHIVHWRLYVGLPLLTPILVLSRTNTNLADGILPVLPIVFFASQAHSPQEAFDFAQWPPSASFSFAVLPYVRSLYNFYYQRVWAKKEAEWLREIQPRTSQAATEPALDNGNQQRQDQDEENVFEVRIDGGLWDEWEDGEQQPAPVPQQHHEQQDEAAPAPNVQDNRPLPGGAANEQPNLLDQQQQQHAQHQAGNNANQAAVDRRISFSPMAIAEKVLGALLFPTVAGLSGEVLKLLLPASWTTPPPMLKTRFHTRLGLQGFLQHKWARSIVGGCLFVIAKDALMLYVRWKMAQMHRGRRVVDFDRTRREAR